MSRTKPTIDEIVNREVDVLMDRGYPLFLNKTEISEWFKIGANSVHKVMRTKEPLIAGRYALRDVLYAIHGA